MSYIYCKLNVALYGTLKTSYFSVRSLYKSYAERVHNQPLWLVHCQQEHWQIIMHNSVAHQWSEALAKVIGHVGQNHRINASWIWMAWWDGSEIREDSWMVEHDPWFFRAWQVHNKYGEVHWQGNEKLAQGIWLDSNNARSLSSLQDTGQCT